jgi:hypothetical protein
MTSPKSTNVNRPLYHITHVNNLAGILEAKCLWCDHERSNRVLHTTNIGHRNIKTRRERRDVTTSANGKLSHYVPFYFCTRSPMLCAIWKGHDDYRGGQEKIVYLVSSIKTAVGTLQPWVFTDRHAELAHTLQYEALDKLTEVRWDVMSRTYWADVKEERQAEFLVKRCFPWTAVEKIITHNAEVCTEVSTLLATAGEITPVEVEPSWYD